MWIASGSRLAQVSAHGFQGENGPQVPTVGKVGLEVAGQRCLGEEGSPVAWVGKPEGGGVEERPGNAFHGAAVEAVAGDGVAQMGQVDADLVGPSGPEETGNDGGVPRAAAQGTHEGRRRASALPDGESPAMVGLAGDGRLDEALIRSEGAEHDAQVQAADLPLPPGCGGRGQCLGPAGEEEHTAGQPVQTVEEAEVGAASLPVGQLDQKPLIHGEITGLPPLRGLREDARRLEGRQEPAVVPENVDGGDRGQRDGNLMVDQKVDDVAGFDGPGKDANGAPVPPDSPLSGQAPGGAAGEVGGGGDELIQPVALEGGWNDEAQGGAEAHARDSTGRRIWTLVPWLIWDSMLMEPPRARRSFWAMARPRPGRPLC